VKLPRDLSGADLAVLLRRYGYEVIRQTGSHLRLTSTLKGREHHLTVPSHKTLKLGTLSAILSEVSRYLRIDRERLADQIFSR
jgi:predicted RNA binding protein YcfA (HicA-like mRNA interferase family)